MALGIYSSSFTFSSCQDLCCCLADHFFGIYLWGPYIHLNHSPKPLRTALSACSHELPATLLSLTGTVTGPPSRDTGSSSHPPGACPSVLAIQRCLCSVLTAQFPTVPSESQQVVYLRQDKQETVLVLGSCSWRVWVTLKAQGQFYRRQKCS